MVVDPDQENEKSAKDHATSSRNELTIGLLAFTLIALLAYLAAFGYLPDLSKSSPTSQSQVSPTEQEAKAEERRNRLIEVRVGVLTLFFAGLAALFAFLAYRANKREADATEHQVRIMREQLDHERAEMARMVSPRLSIERVWMENFGQGSAPVFFIEIKNSGPSDAEQVAVDIRAHLMGGTSAYSAAPHRMGIPANSVRQHFIKSQFILSTETMQQMNQDGSLLRVTGYVEYSGRRMEYCYKYNHNPWGISNLPLLIPCDFDTTRTVTAAIEPAKIKFTAVAASLTKTTKPPEGVV